MFLLDLKIFKAFYYILKIKNIKNVRHIIYQLGTPSQAFRLFFGTYSLFCCLIATILVKNPPLTDLKKNIIYAKKFYFGKISQRFEEQSGLSSLQYSLKRE
jgi:hypothetical protein